jgi:predicted Fe-Mo cluster-binding NifX family protein
VLRHHNDLPGRRRCRRRLRDQRVDTIICAGVQDAIGDLVRASGIKMISWVSGRVEDLLIAYLEGRLAPGNESESPSLDEEKGGSDRK